MNYIGIDPAIVNYGIGVLDTKFKVIGTAMLDSPMNTLVGETFVEQGNDFVKKAEKLIKMFKPKIITSERYQTRGFKGVQIEIVSHMNGMLDYICKKQGVEFNLIIASQWKTSITRLGVDLNVLYAKAKQVKIPPHRLDAALIAAYGAQGNKFKSKSQVLAIAKNVAIDLPRRK